MGSDSYRGPDFDRRTVLATLLPVLAGCSGFEMPESDDSTTPDENARAAGEELLDCSGGTVETGIEFTDLAAKEDSAFEYRRGRNEEAVAELAELKDQGEVSLDALNQIEETSTNHAFGQHGGYGITIFDSTGDGTLDIFVPNSEGNPHHLYRNKLANTGAFTFEEVADEAGVAAPDHEGYGCAAADVDNDGHRELVVLSPPGQRHRFFDNDGGGNFTDVSQEVDIVSNGGHLPSFGDIDNNGYVDLFVGTSRDGSGEGAPHVPYEGYARNRLFKNRGGFEFEEISETSGVQDMDGIPDDSGGTRTFGVAMVDIDQDGAIEILHGDDQMIPPAADEIPGEGGENWGQVHVFDNDESGNFTDMMDEYTLAEYSVLSNMGFSFGDFDYDGRLDFLTTAFGDYIPTFIGEDPLHYNRGEDTTKWFIQQPDGSFETYGTGRLVATPFGWGTAAIDYDNDGYTDLVYHGGGDFSATKWAIGTNPGVILKGLGHGMFAFDEGAARSSETDHNRRMVYGLAVGDLNGNGYPDIVTGANQDVAQGSELEPIDVEYGGPFDDYALANRTFEPDPDGEGATYTGFDFTDGSLAVEVNDGGTDNNWIAVKPAGGMGLDPECGVNRDGIGAVITCTPSGFDRSATLAVTAGSSYGSCHSLEKTFGLADAEVATVEILWPGGVRNKLYDVEHGERIVFPEIPVDYDSDLDRSDYEDIVAGVLSAFGDEGVISTDQVDPFLTSALRAYDQ